MNPFLREMIGLRSKKVSFQWPLLAALLAMTYFYFTAKLSYNSPPISYLKGAMVMEENKEMLELLKSIEKTGRQQARTSRLVCLFAFVAVVSCVAALVQVMNILPQLEEILPQIHTVMSQMQTVLGNLEQTTAQLAAVDLQSMVSNVDTLVATGQQSLEQTMGKLNSIDLDTLNKAIADLAMVIEPLAKIVARLK